MKTKILFFSFILMLGIGASFTPKQASAQGGPVSFQIFYDDLTPYGSWVISPEYGYVWVPNVGPGFTPYATNGYWIFTDEGWTWVSNYSWGWAPFHYGRWYNDPNYGYMWVPDNEWGPGWVTWRRSEGYYGWAPIGPGISINVAYSNGYDVPYNQWTFVHDRDFGRRNINNYYVRSSNNVTIINNSTVINNTHMNRTRNVSYNAGPERTEVEKRAGKTFTPVVIKESSRPGQKVSSSQLQIYRPQVQKNAADGHKPAPSKVQSMDKLKPSQQRATEPPSQKGNPPAKQQPQQKPPQQKPPQQSLPPNQQQPQHNPQPARQTPPQQQQPQQKPPQQSQPAKQQPQQKPPQQSQPAKQQPQQKPPQQSQPAKQQPQQQPQHNPQPAKQAPPQQQPPKQQPSQPQKANPPKSPDEDKNPHKLFQPFE